jgi:predicted protein tyrosine phosphatase
LLTKFSFLTVCGLDELWHHRAHGVTHVLSLLDPGWPEPEAFTAYDAHHRTTLHFHDAVVASPALVLPQASHVAAILEFGNALHQTGEEAHPLVHCHAGLSRSTAAMAILIAQREPELDEIQIFARLRSIRPRSWPNSLLIRFADEALKRKGQLVSALAHHYEFQLRQDPDLEELLIQAGRDCELAMVKGEPH